MVRREGVKAEEGRVGRSWWELMVEEENEEWKEVKRKKEDDRRAREERRKRWRRGRRGFGGIEDGEKKKGKRS